MVVTVSIDEESLSQESPLPTPPTTTTPAPRPPSTHSQRPSARARARQNGVERCGASSFYLELFVNRTAPDEPTTAARVSYTVLNDWTRKQHTTTATTAHKLRLDVLRLVPLHGQLGLAHGLDRAHERVEVRHGRASLAEHAPPHRGGRNRARDGVRALERLLVQLGLAGLRAQLRRVLRLLSRTVHGLLRATCGEDAPGAPTPPPTPTPALTVHTHAPTVSPTTAAPSVPTTCDDDEHRYELWMTDSGGDGWGGATWAVATAAGAAEASGTMASGFVANSSLCLADGEYELAFANSERAGDDVSCAEIVGPNGGDFGACANPVSAGGGGGGCGCDTLRVNDGSGYASGVASSDEFEVRFLGATVSATVADDDGGVCTGTLCPGGST